MITVCTVTIFFVLISLAMAWPLGKYIARVIEAPEEISWLLPLRWVENRCAAVIGIAYRNEMSWKEYFFAFLALHTVAIVLLFMFLRWQSIFAWLDPKAVDFSAYAAFNTAISFVTNTDWESYVPETQMSWPIQMIGLTTQNFLSAGVGVTLLCALARSFRRAETNKLGNFWQDLTRFSIYVLLPLSCIIAVALMAAGVPQSLSCMASYTSLEGTSSDIPIGMCASQIAIKQLGTNGGGFFAVNSAHPLENPSIWSHVIELVAIVLIPMALCRTFGELVRCPRQGLLFLCVMGTLFVGAVCCACYAESATLPFVSPGEHSLFQAEGNMEGKECRLGPFWSILWAVATTATSNGSVSCSLSSLFPLSSGVSLGLMKLGEVVFGGIGTGMTTGIVLLLISVFIAGLMVGRTPEYLEKKIEACEMKLVALLTVFPSAVILLATATVIGCQAGLEALSVKGPHRMTEVLYAFSSTTGNNGSSFAGLDASSPLYNLATGIVMYLGRMFPAALTLALAGVLVQKKHVAKTLGTLHTDSLAFGLWFAFVIIMIGALNFLPAFTLGPIVEHINLFLPM